MKTHKPTNSENRGKKNRQLLQRATTQYSKSLSPLETEEESSLVEFLAQASGKVKFDEDSEDEAPK